MADEIGKVKQIIAEHTTVREHLKLLGEKINDLEALKDLEELRLSFSHTDQVGLADKLRELTQVMNFLDEGLRKHFEDEDKLLPGMLGAPLAQALSLEHRQIMEEIAKLMEMSENKRFEEISQQRSPALAGHIYQIINTLYKMVKEHLSKEDIILQMLLVGLQES